MREVRTIEWAGVSEWVAENEQQIRDVMKFEGLKGAMVEVLRLAPDQSELAALREELAEWKARAGRRTNDMGELSNEKLELQQRLADAERRNAALKDCVQESLTELTVMKKEIGFRAHTLVVIEKLAVALTKPEEAKS